MKIGYPCINRHLGCTTNSTFRLANFSNERLIEKVESNLDCLEKILAYNVDHGLLFFRISSDLIPFAGHKINKFNWVKYFKKRFESIGGCVKENDIRISMHPDQFVLINSLSKEIVRKSILELKWHCRLLDLMGLDQSAKVQIHLGGIYGDKERSKRRFIENYRRLPVFIKNRLVIENDDRMYSLKDCLSVSKKTGIPVLFDVFHHRCLNNGESITEALKMIEKTWKKEDGAIMVDYSSQNPSGRKGKHVESIDIKNFKKYIKETQGFHFDLMLEIKDKEKSALKAVETIKSMFEFLK